MPSTLEELRNATFKEFVPANEENETKAKLMSLNTNASVWKHISVFQELVKI